MKILGGQVTSVLRGPMKPEDMDWYLRSLSKRLRRRSLKGVYGKITAPRVPNLGQGPRPRGK